MYLENFHYILKRLISAFCDLNTVRTIIHNWFIHYTQMKTINFLLIMRYTQDLFFGSNNLCFPNKFKTVIPTSYGYVFLKLDRILRIIFEKTTLVCILYFNLTCFNVM